MVWWLTTPVILAPESLGQDGEFKDNLGTYSKFVSTNKQTKKARMTLQRGHHFLGL